MTKKNETLPPVYSGWRKKVKTKSGSGDGIHSYSLIKYL